MAVRVDQSETLGVKMVKSTAGGKVTYSWRNLGNLNPNLTDDDAYSVGVGWSGMTDHVPEDIRRTIQYSIGASSLAGGVVNG